MHGLATVFHTVILLYILRNNSEIRMIVYDIQYLTSFPFFPSSKWIQTLIPLRLGKKPDQLSQ